jgi:hypothetical protein
VKVEKVEKVEKMPEVFNSNSHGSVRGQRVSGSFNPGVG